MEPVEVRFGRVVRQLREAQGVSQENFAALAGIHRTYVSSIELGKVAVSISIAEQLSKALGTPLSEIWKTIELESSQPRKSRSARSH
jgi:transcriptional regulator with XRE-family HTH domain